MKQTCLSGRSVLRIMEKPETFVVHQEIFPIKIERCISRQALYNRLREYADRFPYRHGDVPVHRH
jgi:hypothetical protein